MGRSLSDLQSLAAPNLRLGFPLRRHIKVGHGEVPPHHIESILDKRHSHPMLTSPLSAIGQWSFREAVQRSNWKKSERPHTFQSFLSDTSANSKPRNSGLASRSHSGS